MAKGGDYADLYFEHTINNYCSLEDSKVNSAYSNIDYGVGIRVIKGDQTGYAYCENITLENMLKSASTAASIASSKSGFSPGKTSEILHPDYYPVKSSWESFSIKKKIPFIQRMNDNIFAGDKRVKKVNGYAIRGLYNGRKRKDRKLFCWPLQPDRF